ncbi:hypothetical protein [Haloarchaeobius baliensis]|uniref:hypothetical protein n=1 Tax=Haloarchaeobius baliensis TaxID=1670458 RepID=UPI003F8823F4
MTELGAEQLDFALQLLQLIALALPAIAILLQVMVDTNMEVNDIVNRQDPRYSKISKHEYERVGVYKTTVADKQTEFVLAQYSLILLLVSALVLVSYVFTGIFILETVGIISIGIAFLLLGVSVVFMTDVSAKALLWRMRIALIGPPKNDEQDEDESDLGFVSNRREDD